MRDWIHWLWQQWEWAVDLFPDLTREVVWAEEALLGGFTLEQRQLYEALEDVSKSPPGPLGAGCHLPCRCPPGRRTAGGDSGQYRRTIHSIIENPGGGTILPPRTGRIFFIAIELVI